MTVISSDAPGEGDEEAKRRGEGVGACFCSMWASAAVCAGGGLKWRPLNSIRRGDTSTNGGEMDRGTC